MGWDPDQSLRGLSAAHGALLGCGADGVHRTRSVCVRASARTCAAGGILQGALQGRAVSSGASVKRNTRAQKKGRITRLLNRFVDAARRTERAGGYPDVERREIWAQFYKLRRELGEFILS